MEDEAISMVEKTQLIYDPGGEEASHVDARGYGLS